MNLAHERTNQNLTIPNVPFVFYGYELGTASTPMYAREKKQY